MRKRFVRWLLALSLGSGAAFFALSAFALIPLMAAGLMFADATLGYSFTNALIASGTVITGIIFVGNCQGTALGIFDCENGAPKTVGEAVASSFTGARPIQVKLNPDAKRSNPNPAKFDDPAANQRDVTAKTTYKLVMDYATKPGNGSLAAIAGGPVGNSKYVNSDGTTATEADVIDISGYSGSDALKDSAARAATSSAHSGWNWSCCYVQQSGVGATRAVWYRTISMSCDAGYTKQANGDCLKTDEAAVKKPDTAPCEVLYDATTKRFSYEPRTRTVPAFNPALSRPAMESSDFLRPTTTAVSKVSKQNPMPKAAGTLQRTTAPVRVRLRSRPVRTHLLPVEVAAIPLRKLSPRAGATSLAAEHRVQAERTRGARAEAAERR